MAKTSGLGDNFYIGQYDLSGDVGSLSSVHGGNTPLPVTGINSSANERIGGKRDGGMSFMTYFNTATGRAHPALSILPTTDRIASYFRGAAIGNEVASLVGLQIGYDGSRAEDGGFTFNVDVQADKYGLEWGLQLTPGLRTDTAATLGTALDTTASVSQGAQAYLHVTAFTGTDVTIKIQDSADNVTFADVTGLTFTTVTAVTSERIATASGAAIRRYLRATTTTSGGVTSVTFAVNVVKNATAVTF